mmetsp:Transcript_25080/g.54581  ORF Transcript_25080/g.54581 Transcript_25080/m.54581 type:complete len:137 (-) Transcript_25080:77-487(-)
MFGLLDKEGGAAIIMDVAAPRSQLLLRSNALRASRIGGTNGPLARKLGVANTIGLAAPKLPNGSLEQQTFTAVWAMRRGGRYTSDLGVANFELRDVRQRTRANTRFTAACEPGLRPCYCVRFGQSFLLSPSLPFNL